MNRQASKVMQKEFDKAAAIWKKLGKTREVNRVRKKKTKESGEKKQLKFIKQFLMKTAPTWFHLP